MAARVFCLWRKPVGRLWLAEAGVRTLPCRTVVSPRPGFTSEFRSEYSLDKIYPSEQKETDIRKDSAKQLTNIPVDRLSISYCRSSGPGGQNVNKVNTKAEVRFHLASADWISEDVRQKMAVMQKNKISKTGELIVTSEVSRYQMRNLAACLQKIRDMIAEASEVLQVPVKSKEDAEAIRNRVEKMNCERLRQKKMWSSIKQSRRMDVD